MHLFHSVSSRFTQIFIPCTRGGQGFTGGELKVSNFRLLSVSCICSPGCAPHPSILFFSPNFYCSAGRSETRWLGLGAETVSLLEKHPLFKVNLHKFSVLPSIVKEKVGERA